MYSGPEHCKACGKDKSYNHWNMVLFNVSLARWQWWVQLPPEQKNETFISISTVKTYCLNQYMAHTIFPTLGSDMSSKKIIKLFIKRPNIGNIPA
jgi:hypothetical protein